MDQRTRRLLFGAVGCAGLFAAILVLAYGFPAAREADAKALQGFLGFQRPSVSAATNALTSVGDPPVVALLGALLALIAFLRGRPRIAVAVVALIGLTSVSSQLLKAVLAYPRYTGTAFAHIPSEAFPSGHSTAVMSLAIAAVMVVPARMRPLAALVGTGVALAVGVALISVAAHFPSDVAGGYLLATFWGLVLAVGLGEAGRRWPERTVRSRLAGATEAVAGAGLAALAVAGALGLAGLALVVVVKADLSELVAGHTAALVVAGALLVLALLLLSGFVIGLRRRGSE